MSLYILSLSPVDSLVYLAGLERDLEVHFLGIAGITVPQPILIHALGYPEAGTDLTPEIMAEFGFTPETFPAYGIQGWAEIAQIWSNKGRSPLIRLNNTYFLEEPIYDVLPPLQVTANCLWLPQTPAQITACEWALSVCYFI
ncbi:MAG: hypothetical protein ACK4QL_09305 [Pseudanabaenaceae cyanobacterium]